MSDLVRGVVREPKPGAPAPPAPTPPAPRAPAAEDSPRRPEVAPPPAPAAPQAPPDQRSAEEAEALFAELVGLLARVRQLMRTGEPFPWDELEGRIEHARGSLERSGDLFWVANSSAAPAGADYLAVHQARVAVLSMRLGADAGYDPPGVVRLGLAGALIDVGLWQLPERVLAHLDALSPDEEAQYQSHPRLSAEWLRRWTPRAVGLVDAVLQHHEREQGQGFPQGLVGGAINPDAKILGLVDMYTGLTLPAPPRPRLRPHEAVREIVRAKREAFPASLIKILLSEISVFPPGTLVRLNTGEVGRVVGVNRDHPLRPRVEVLADGKGQRQATPKTIDLAEAPFLYITGPVAEGAR